MAAKHGRRRTHRILGTKTGSERGRKVVDLTAFRKEVMRGYDRAAGKVREFKDPWQDGKIK